MKNLTVLFLVLMTVMMISCTSGSSEVEKIPLFTEKSTDWHTRGNAIWDISNGELIARLDSGAGFAQTKAVYSDFELNLEFRPDSTINSGVYIRCGEATTPSNCYEINIWDLHPNQEYRTGAVVLKAKPLDYVETLNKWNTYKIRCEKGRIQAWVNGIQTADLTDTDFTEGYVALQAAEKGEVRFRNIELIPL